MLIRNIGLNTEMAHSQPATIKHRPKENEISSDKIDQQYLKDCYKKQSDRDVPMMKGDCGPRLKKTYKRWDKDLQTWDVREKGSLPLKRRNTKCGTLAKTYREFAALPYDMPLGAVRSLYGTIGLSAIRHAIRTQGVLTPGN